MLPSPYNSISFGLDPSWVVGVNLALINNLQFGPDIAFTFGPLGFLYNPFYVDNELWFISFIYMIFAHFSFLFGFMLLMVRSSATWKEYLVVFPILIISIYLIKDYMLLLSAAIFLFLILTKRINSKYYVPLLFFVSLILAISSLIKFNMLIASLSYIIAFLLICNFRKELIKYSYLPVLYFGFVLFLWLVSGQFLSNLPVYLFNSYQISNGYQDAMAINGPFWQVLAGLMSILFMIILFIYSYIKKIHHLLFFIFLNSVFLFLIFKDGFVRHDAHVLRFIATYAILFACIFIIFRRESNFVLRSISLLISFLFITSLYIGVPGIAQNNIVQNFPNYQLTSSLIFNESFQTKFLEDSKNSIKQTHPLDDKTIKYLGNKKVDIFPWDIALLWAYNISWSPRPVIQSYSAYTQYLDNLNAQHFSKDKAPDAILYSFKSIDERYPLFDEPSTFASILNNYTLVGRSGEFLLLSYKPEKNLQLIEEKLGSVMVEPGQPIKIPQYKSGSVFGHIELKYSTFGKIMKTFYKPALAHIRFKFSNSTYSRDYRFIPGVSMNGVFLSRYVGNLEDLESVFSGNMSHNIEEIIISVDNPIYYDKQINVNFIGFIPN